MNKDSTDFERNGDSLVRDIGIIISVIESGHSVELPATGYSMFPKLRPGDKVVVKPLAKDEIPEIGSVVVCVDEGIMAQRHKGVMAEDKSEERKDDPTILVMHRLVGIIESDSDKPLFITRGDSRLSPDEPWHPDQLLGVAISYKRGKRKYLLKAFLPGNYQYRFNSRLLWFYGKFMWLKTKLVR